MTYPTSSLPDLIASHNAGREPERLAIKYKNMRENAFVFLRGSCRLFYERMAANGLAPQGPVAWICGDLHMENFGTYLTGTGPSNTTAADGLIYFDVNDFDEAVHAPHAFDVLRLATSVLVAAETIGLGADDGKAAATRLAVHYFGELAAGNPRAIKRGSAKGPIAALVEKLRARDPVKFIDKRTSRSGKRRALLTDGDKALPLPQAEKDKLSEFCAGLSPPAGHPGGFAFLDAARRIAGTGSLGIARHVILVEGDGSPNGNWLLDLKSALPSALAAHAGRQPPWPSEAHRVVEVQRRFQAASPWLLSPHQFGGTPFVLKQLQPSADKLELAAIAADTDAFDIVIDAMAHLTAWGHLRGAGHDGAASVAELVASANRAGAPDEIVKQASELAKLTRADWRTYAAAYDAGKL